jgi:hypothetical protein
MAVLQSHPLLPCFTLVCCTVHPSHQAQHGTSQQFEDLQDPQQQQQQQQQLQQQQQQQQQQQPGLDLSGLAVPPLARKRLTGPVLLVPQPDPPPPGLTAKQAADAARAAALAAQPEGGGVLEALVVPEGCLLLHSWQESAAAREPPGEVATRNDGPGPAAAAAGGGGGGSGGGVGVGVRAASAAAAAAAGGVDVDDVMQPGIEVVVTLSVMDTSRRLTVVQQEIQVGLGNRLDMPCCTCLAQNLLRLEHGGDGGGGRGGCVLCTEGFSWGGGGVGGMGGGTTRVNPASVMGRGRLTGS